MAKVTLYKKDGSTAGEVSLPDTLFAVEADPVLVHEAVVYQQANSRAPIAHTKGRGEVRGGGRKPWRQKGTGRARHGSRRSPIWVGGGITFGPTSERNFSKKMNRKARRKALAMVLTDKLAEERFIAVEDLTLTEAKTKAFSSILAKLPVAGKKTLIVLDPENINAAMAARNIPRVSTIPAHSLNVVDLLSHDYVLVPKEAIDVITATYKRD